MTTDKEVEDEIELLATEISQLVVAKAKHVSALHESDRAKNHPV